MTNPIEDDAQLPRLSDDYIRDLEPENQRYDITLASDFVISVLPNGIKTWAFIYDFQGRHRRKTLGVFPEMNFKDAKVALEKARASMVRMDEPTVAPNEFGQLPAVLGGGKYIPKKSPSPFNWLRLLKILGVLAGLAAIGGVATLVSRGWNPFGGGSAVTTEPAPAPAQRSLPFTLDREMNNSGDSADQVPAADAEPAPATETNSTPTTAISTPAPSAVSSSSSTPRPQNTTASTGQLAAPAAGTGSSNNSQPAPSSTPSRQSAAPARPVTALTSPTRATAYGGRVSRSRLTSRVQDLEPVDTLGPEISYRNSGFTRVFYFTELREFSDGTVVHRWSLNGNIMEEVELQVRTSWRWRTYSNKDLTPGLNGQWKVETIDASGKILDSEEFTYDYQ